MLVVRYALQPRGGQQYCELMSAALQAANFARIDVALKP
jgi:hypothetical protein